MELYIGRSNSWDPMCYPRVGQWPLPEEKERQLFLKYANLLKEAYTSHARWHEAAYPGGYRSPFGNRLDEYYQNVKLDGDEMPEEVFVVMGFHPERITWPGEFHPFRLRIEVVWWNKRTPAFATREEAEVALRECADAKPDSRFMIAIVPVKG